MSGRSGYKVATELRMMNAKQKKLRALCRRHSVCLIYLFGSRQEEGKQYLLEGNKPKRQESDLDIAVVIENQNHCSIADIYKDLFVDLVNLFAPFNPDLVILNEMDPLFQFEVICGTCVYSESEEFQDEFEERAMRFAEDLRFKSIEFHHDFAEARRDGYFEIEPL